MKAAERDELLIRVDERVGALKEDYDRDIPSMKEHLERLNGQVGKNTAFRRLACWIGGALFVALLGLSTALIVGD